MRDISFSFDFYVSLPQIDSEETVYTAVMRWVYQEALERSVHLPMLLRNIRLPVLSVRFLTDVVDKDVSVYIFDFHPCALNRQINCSYSLPRSTNRFLFLACVKIRLLIVSSNINAHA